MARTCSCQQYSRSPSKKSVKSQADCLESENIAPISSDRPCITSLEEEMLARSKAYAKLYQAIFDKYDRKFSRKESGGDCYNFSDPEKFESQLKEDKESGTTICLKYEPFEYDFNLDNEKTITLRNKISQAKMCFNWDAETAKYHMQLPSEDRTTSDEEETPDTTKHKKLRKRRRSMSSAPLQEFCSRMDRLLESSYLTSDSEDEQRASFKQPPKLKRDGISGMESGYYDSDVHS